MILIFIYISTLLPVDSVDILLKKNESEVYKETEGSLNCLCVQ